MFDEVKRILPFWELQIVLERKYNHRKYQTEERNQLQFTIGLTTHELGDKDFNVQKNYQRRLRKNSPKKKLQAARVG